MTDEMMKTSIPIQFSNIPQGHELDFLSRFALASFLPLSCFLFPPLRPFIAFDQRCEMGPIIHSGLRHSPRSVLVRGGEKVEELAAGHKSAQE